MYSVPDASIRIKDSLSFRLEDFSSEDQLLHPSRLTFVAENAGAPETSDGVKRMTELRNSSIKAFIGPDESCYAEALVADAWNIPMINYVS